VKLGEDLSKWIVEEEETGTMGTASSKIRLMDSESNSLSAVVRGKLI
jgi:hypothetical protein